LIDKSSNEKVSGEEEHENEEMQEEGSVNNEQLMLPSRGMMTKLILFRVWRRLSRNPNLHAAVLGIVWALISSRYFKICES
jgi:auxin efflux carrier family